jgi:hypothetical protein
MRVASVMAALAAMGLPACGSDTAGECDPAHEECTYAKDVSTIDVGAGVEDESTCQSWTLDNPTELWVNSITQHNNGAYHHANWFFVPDNEFAAPDGSWKCGDYEFDELVAALLGGYLFALSTQSLDETQALPTGSAIRIPPYSRIIGSSHLLNALDEPVKTTMQLEIHTIPEADVKAKMAPARIQYHDLKLDPMSKSAFTTECLFDDKHQEFFGEPLQYELHYALSHYHQLGMYTQLEVAGGPHDGEVLARHDGYGENFGKAFDPPIELGAMGAKGIRFTCGFSNPRTAKVGWGIGDQEMCVVALQARTNISFDADVVHDSETSVETMPDGEIRHHGPCSITAFPWDQTKPGGPPR